ncbi:MAG: hypothetical protein C4584_02855 [Armatimonadetes bacterium]|nr:MAG: hypothetical protein C4584_02855 [Armatimonadota bacterium]
MVEGYQVASQTLIVLRVMVGGLCIEARKCAIAIAVTGDRLALGDLGRPLPPCPWQEQVRVHIHKMRRRGWI